MSITAGVARILMVLSDGVERSAVELSESGARKSPAKLQPILRQLEESGWVSCRRGVAARRGEPPRAAFTITIGGKRALHEHQIEQEERAHRKPRRRARRGAATGEA